MRILNLYSGLGGNRKLWSSEHEITAVENNKAVAEIYQKFFPEDKVLVEDAHAFLLNHFEEFDFIWSSPPCPTHSVVNSFLNAQGIKRYSDMALWQEILYLENFYKGKWAVENVRTYYKPLVKPYEVGRHFFWTNFYVDGKFEYNDFNTINARDNTRKSAEENLVELKKLHGFDLSGFGLSKNLQAKFLRNCVVPELGKHIFDCALKQKQTKLSEVLR